MRKFVCIVIDVIFKFGSPKKKTHKFHKNNAMSKTFLKYAFGMKKLKNKQNFIMYMDLRKYGQILTIRKSLVIKRLRFSKKSYLYEFIILYYIIY